MSAREVLLGRLRSVVETGDGDPKGITAARFAVLHMYPSGLSSQTVALRYDLTKQRFIVVSSGTTPRQVLWVSERTQAALLGWTPQLDGWSCGPVQSFDPEPVHDDDDDPESDTYTSSTSYWFDASRV